jgi:uracil-DNA glycosylase family 4
MAKKPTAPSASDEKAPVKPARKVTPGALAKARTVAEAAGPSADAAPGFDTYAAAAACDSLTSLEALIPTCSACPRLRSYCQVVAAEKTKRFASEEFWGRPVPGFGDPDARILIVGLAPAALGANRTGRLFTGDRSGDFLYAALHRVGLASQAQSTARGDGLTLRGVYISAAGRCAPPDNRPTPEELTSCRAFLLRELALLKNLRVVIVLGAIAHEALLLSFPTPTPEAEPPASASTPSKAAKRPKAVKFAHGATFPLPREPGLQALTLMDCYHVSQQNTFTGLLTPAMLDQVLQQARTLAQL